MKGMAAVKQRPRKPFAQSHPGVPALSRFCVTGAHKELYFRPTPHPTGAQPPTLHPPPPVAHNIQPWEIRANITIFLRTVECAFIKAIKIRFTFII